MKYWYYMMLSVVLILVMGCSEDDKVGAIEMFEHFDTKVETVWPEKEGDLYASWLYLAPSLSRVYDNSLLAEDVIKLTFTNPSMGMRIGLRMEECSIAEETYIELLTGKEDTICVRFPVMWKLDALRKWNDATPVELSWTISINGEYAGVYKKSFVCQPVDKCVTEVQTEGQTLSTRAMYAGYIEEDNPKCGDLIREALDLGIVNSFLEYQIGIEFVKEQMFAFWCALENRGIQIKTQEETAVQGICSMHSFDRVLERKEGSVLDMTMILSALFQRIGLCTVIETRPNGVYIAIADNFFNQKPDLVYFLDVTKFGALPESELSIKDKIENSRNRFEQAILNGSRLYEEDREQRLEHASAYEELWLDTVRLYMPSLQLFNN